MFTHCGCSADLNESFSLPWSMEFLEWYCHRPFQKTHATLDRCCTESLFLYWVPLGVYSSWVLRGARCPGWFASRLDSQGWLSHVRRRSGRFRRRFRCAPVLRTSLWRLFCRDGVSFAWLNAVKDGQTTEPHDGRIYYSCCSGPWSYLLRYGCYIHFCSELA